jgi:uncharacterized protein YbaA (DUF1428 family)
MSPAAGRGLKRGGRCAFWSGSEETVADDASVRFVTSINHPATERRFRMAHYVDGFVLPVPKRNLDAYRRIARKAGKIWREHGALEYRECVAEDVQVGEVTSFPRSVQLKRGETVVFSWIVFKSRAHRDRVNAKVMKDPRLAGMMNPKAMPFDGKRMIYGGFDVVVDL